MIKNIHLSALGLSIACLLTVTGCDKFGNKNETTADKTKDTSSQTAKTNKTSVDVNEVCADTSIPTNLEKSLRNKLIEQSTTVVAQDSLDKDKVTAETDNITVNISDVKAVEGATVSDNGLVSCQANVSLELPEDMVSRANEVYKKNNQNDDVLDANTIKDEAFAFTIDSNAKENNLQILGQSALLGVVSNTLANSSLKAQGSVSKSSSSTDTNSNNATAPTQSVAPTTSSTTTAEQRALAKKRAQARAKKRAQEKARAKRRAEEKARAKKQAQESVAKKQTQEKSQQKAVTKKTNEDAVIKAQRAKENIKDPKQLKQKITVETQKKPVVKAKPVAPVKKETPKKVAPPAKAPAQSKPLGVKNAENIEVVIVEEDGTY